jgi:hypothetical protein
LLGSLKTPVRESQLREGFIEHSGELLQQQSKTQKLLQIQKSLLVLLQLSNSPLC